MCLNVSCSLTDKVTIQSEITTEVFLAQTFLLEYPLKRGSLTLSFQVKIFLEKNHI